MDACTQEITRLPVVIVGHLLHDLAVNLIPQSIVFSGGAEDLVSEFEGILLLLGGVITHVLQDWYTAVKDG